MSYRIALTVFALVPTLATAASGADWITAPSYYTHDPQTGQRVTQYTPIGPFYTFARPDYLRSGYRHTRSSIQVGNAADHLHVVEEWGRAVRPYGEWRFPYRPYSVPYPAWGAPYAGLNQAPWFGYAPYGVPYGGHGQGGQWNPYDNQQPPPYYDGSYPRYRSRPATPGRDGRRPGRGPGHPGHSPPGHPGTGHGGPAPGHSSPPASGGSA